MEEDAEIGNSYYVIIIFVNEFPSPEFPFPRLTSCQFLLYAPSLQNTKISMYTRSSVSYRQLSKAAVCFFRVKSIVGRYFTTYEDEYNEIIPIMTMHMLCSKLPLVQFYWRI